MFKLRVCGSNDFVSNVDVDRDEVEYVTGWSDDRALTLDTEFEARAASLLVMSIDNVPCHVERID